MSAVHAYLNTLLVLSLLVVVQFSSVQDGIYALEKTLCAPPRLLEVSPTLPWKRFQYSSIDNGPFSSIQERSSSASFFSISFLQAIDGVMFLALCPRVQLLNTSDLPRSKPLGRVALLIFFFIVFFLLFLFQVLKKHLECDECLSTDVEEESGCSFAFPKKMLSVCEKYDNCIKGF